MSDPQETDFKPLVNQTLDSKSSINIDGRAGTGKSTFINLYTEMNNRTFENTSLAPTNNACRVINGITIHRFIASFNMKSLMNNKCEYFFIDEISMVHEMY